MTSTRAGVIERDTPYVIAWVVAVTALIIFVLVGSALLPLKAILANALSITASFGALTWIFQDGHLSRLLDFTPRPIDPVVPVLLFCLVFGASMDYEVLLLSRIREEYLRAGNTAWAVAHGVHGSGGVIIGAAAILVTVFGAFALADVVVLKSIGLGMAIAVTADATVVRLLVVPATMALLDRWNWWPSPRVRAAPAGRRSQPGRLPPGLERRLDVRLGLPATAALLMLTTSAAGRAMVLAQRHFEPTITVPARDLPDLTALMLLLFGTLAEYAGLLGVAAAVGVGAIRLTASLLDRRQATRSSATAG